MKKGNIHTVEVTAYTSEGAGIARIEGMAVFVPGTLRGEKCEIMILKVEKSFAYAKLIRVITPSDERVESECKYYPKCGGCTMWHMSYAEELCVKEEHVRSCIERIAKVDAPVLPIIGAESVHRYRNKAQFPVGKDATSGFYRPRSHDIVPSENCLIQSTLADEIRAVVHEWQKICKITAYDEKKGTGVLRHIYVRNGEGGALLCLVVTEKPKNTDKLVEIITERCPDVCGIVLNINKKNTNVILGDKYITLWGKSTLSDTLCGSTFSISPAAFYQVNHAQTEKLYDIATSLALQNGAKTALDLYCGIGTITLKLAKSMERVIGVEVVPQAIEDAKKNAEINGIT
ncbi:MAG: 23S rRNA (uracil(1939)-C(5))-methyltransferase RlmD, partial [Oscillospiraceae bacterium]|nr:23S rRNA (uracil(1939)-C(5))-methyltransferase RlmD [Oscillospiraceae bacterium]